MLTFMLSAKVKHAENRLTILPGVIERNLIGNEKLSDILHKFPSKGYEELQTIEVDFYRMTHADTKTRKKDQQPQP